MDYTNYAGMAGQAVQEPTDPTVSEPGVAEPNVEPSKVDSGKVYNCTRLNVREAPDTNAAIVCVIKCGTEVKIDEAESTDDFYKVCLASGVEGFCMKDYIEI